MSNQTQASLFDQSTEELKAYVKTCGQPAFRAKQLETWLLKGITNPYEMGNLPKALRDKLRTDFRDESFTCVNQLASGEDQTTKYVFRLADGNIVEAVYMVYHYGTSVCISSQAGCQMGCTFCASADAGFGRNLTAGEMLGQVAYIGRERDRRIDSVVVMGIGEPLENYDELMRFISLVNDERGLGIGKRHLTVSTCGIVPQMLKFADEEDQVNLAVSLHAPDDRLRRELMPISKVYKMDQLMDACRYYLKKSTRRLTFEYILLAGINDRPEQAEALAALVKGMNCLINLIPANEFPGGLFRRSSQTALTAFREVLEAQHIQVTTRRELGRDIQAACGQLRRRQGDE